MKRKFLSVFAVLLLAATLLSCNQNVIGTKPHTPSKEIQTSGLSQSPTLSVSISPSVPSMSPILTPTPSPTLTPIPVSTPIPSFDPLTFYDYQFEFKSDLSEYEKYMNIVGEDYLYLVNADNRLGKDYKPSDLITVINTRDDGRDKVKMREVAAKALEALYIEAEACGMLYNNKVWQSNGIYYDYYVLSVTSAYRSYASQESLYETAVKNKMNQGMTREEAEAAVLTTAKPGASEHQTGLCADMHNFATANSTNGMREEFAACEAGKWLVENCHKFGFILRYPEDKTEETGIGYESWHFRYVGRFHATRMKELGYCLEEYVEYLEQYGYVNTIPTA